MKSIKIILGGIGFLVFAICCILLTTLTDAHFLSGPGVLSLIGGIIMVISGLLMKDNN